MFDNLQHPEKALDNKAETLLKVSIIPENDSRELVDYSSNISTVGKEVLQYINKQINSKSLIIMPN